MPHEIRNVWTFLKLHRFLFAYLFIVAAVVLTLTRVQMNEDARRRDDRVADQRTCVQTVDTLDKIIKLVDKLTPLTPHITEETPDQRKRIDDLNTIRLQTRDAARAELTPPTCLAELGLDMDGDGRADPERVPPPFVTPR